MKILCVLDHFGSGGAQRQMVNLACGLKANGHIVEMFVYFPAIDFFRAEVEQANIPVHGVQKGKMGSWRVLWQLSRLLRVGKYDVVVSFLGSPNVYATLARLISPGAKLIVSERSSHLGDKSRIGALLKRLLHCLADVLVVNSHSHAEWLRRYPWLRRKVRVVYNGYSLPPSEPLSGISVSFSGFLVVGRVGPEKNGLRLIEALDLFQRKHGFVPIVSWVGRKMVRHTAVEYCRQLDHALNCNPVVKASWNWLGESTEVTALLRQHSALIHPSLYEGLPNVVCEALIAGCPVLASNVCDHPTLVEDGARGFLFDPTSAQSIADAIERFIALSHAQRQQFSENARNFAEKNLSIDRMVAAYEKLFSDGNQII